MRVLVHDYSGHPFQAELSAELARRGHTVTHSWCEAYVSGKGRLSGSQSGVTYESIGRGRVVAKGTLVRRLVQELGFGVELARQAQRTRPDVVLVANAPVPALLVMAAMFLMRRVPWVLWHQDVQGVAVASFAGAKLGRGYRIVAWLVALAERWCARRATAVVVIAEGFLEIHRRWGTADKATVVPNWAPLGDIQPVPRNNAWSREQGLDDTTTLLYSGTLGLKHDPALLVRLAHEVGRQGIRVRLVVVNEGPAGRILRDEAARLDVPLTLLPFQPYERLPEVLGTGDVLVVLLDASASAFSVPSKALSYLCAGRPVLGLLPRDNAVSALLTDAGGAVFAPDESSLPGAAGWVVQTLREPLLAADLGSRARDLAEREFALGGIGDRFEVLLASSARPRLRALREEVPARAG